MNALSAIASCLVLFLAILLAQLNHGHGGTGLEPPVGLSHADRSFVVQAEEAGNAEVAEGRVAQTRGASPTVRTLGARMVHDHSLAGHRLAAIARREGLPVTTSLGADGSMELQHLRALSGRAFDDAYVSGNIPDHRKAIALLQSEAANGRDSALRDWARETLPTLHVHLSLFESAWHRQQ
jgi:putative membrane protein